MASPVAYLLRERIVGECPAIRRARELLVLFAPSELAILIVGQTGTGKELFAQEAHLRSGRTGRLVAVNCGAIPPSIIERELFGHREGAYTGASGDGNGLILYAHMGTLFLDELCSLPLESQAKLLRVIETGILQSLGDPSPRVAQVRVVATIQVPLAEAFERGILRPDLGQRVAGVVIELPPLVERGDDIALLACHLARGLNLAIAPNAVDALFEHSWPGNVRELGQVVARAGRLADGQLVSADAVREAIGLGGRRQVTRRRSSGSHTVDRDAFLAVARRYGGDAEAIGRELGISRATVYRWASDLGVSLRLIARSLRLSARVGR